MLDFREGDLVELISKDGEWNHALKIGMRGIVVLVGGWTNGRGECVGVDWGMNGGEISNYCHALGGVIHSQTGYWVNQDQIRLVDGDPLEFDENFLDSFFEEAMSC